MTEAEILLERDGGVLTIVLNRPQKLNALTPNMFENEIPQIFSDARKDNSVKVLIITGAGNGFCSGIDVGSVGNRRQQEKDMSEVEQVSLRTKEVAVLISAITSIEKPVIAAINGTAVGVGISLALHSDMRFASDKARFSFAFVSRGIIPDCGATYALPRLVGSARALEIMITGDMISAQEADRIGLVNRVFPHEQLLPEVKALAERIAAGPGTAISLTKKALNRSPENTILDQLELEVSYNAMCHRTHDYREGVNAFLEKRKPNFTGK
ncbi:enoyl-CoA hydratase/isomerase family protein [Chloroflexota bacterium]